MKTIHFSCSANSVLPDVYKVYSQICLYLSNFRSLAVYVISLWETLGMIFVLKECKAVADISACLITTLYPVALLFS